MGTLVALGLSIAALIAVWTYLALAVLSLPVWVGVVAWGAFFAAGGKTGGLAKTLASTLSGVLWAFLALTVYGQMGGDNVLVLSLLVAVIAFIMVVQASLPALSFIPGAFLGAAATVGAVVAAGGTYLGVVAALVAGALFGYASEALAGMATAPRKAPAAGTAA